MKKWLIAITVILSIMIIFIILGCSWAWRVYGLEFVEDTKNAFNKPQTTQTLVLKEFGGFKL